MPILGLPLISSNLAQHYRMSVEGLATDAPVQVTFPDFLSTNIVCNTEELVSYFNLEPKPGAAGFSWQEEYQWEGWPQSGYINYRCFFGNWQAPLRGPIAFSVNDQRARPEDSFQLQWLPNLQPPHISCQIKRGDNFEVEIEEDESEKMSDETFLRRHEVNLEFDAVDLENPWACFQSETICRSAVRWYTRGQSARFLWWEDCVSLLSLDKKIAEVMGDSFSKKIVKSNIARAEIILKQLRERSPALAQVFPLKQVTWPLGETGADRLLELIGYDQLGKRRLLRLVREAGVTLLFLSGFFTESKVNHREVSFNRDREQPPPIKDGEEFGPPNVFTIRDLGDACLLGSDQGSVEKGLLAVVMETMDAFKALRECFPGFQELCREAGL